MFPGDYCAGIGPAGWLFMIGFWAAVIAVIMWAVTRLFPYLATAPGLCDGGVGVRVAGRVPGRRLADRVGFGD
jgi:hypothetical protein